MKPQTFENMEQLVAQAGRSWRGVLIGRQVTWSMLVAAHHDPTGATAKGIAKAWLEAQGQTPDVLLGVSHNGFSWRDHTGREVGVIWPWVHPPPWHYRFSIWLGQPVTVPRILALFGWIVIIALFVAWVYLSNVLSSNEVP